MLMSQGLTEGFTVFPARRESGSQMILPPSDEASLALPSWTSLLNRFSSPQQPGGYADLAPHPLPRSPQVSLY